MENTRPLGMHIQGLWFLSPREALQLLQEGALLVDLRIDELVEMKAFSVPSQVRLAYPVRADQARDLPKDKLLILADSTGVYTKGAATSLQALGFERIACLNGGMLTWDQEGMPLATDPAALLSGACPCVLRPRPRPLELR
jgi:rhodanese-related sulfurtransferase